MAKDQAHWLAGALPNHDEVERVEQIGPDLLRVVRKKAPPTTIGVLGLQMVQLTDCQPLLDGDPRPDFIVNIPKEAIWQGEAIDHLQEEGVGWGKMYDLYRALNSEDELSGYRNPGLSFIERIFKQHNNVAVAERISDQVYRLHRYKGDPVVVALTDAYDVTADAVRTAHQALGPFDVLLKNTPYGRISSQGQATAQSLNMEICNQSSIFTRLAK